MITSGKLQYTRLLYGLLFLFLIYGQCTVAQDKELGVYPVGSIERMSPELDDIIKKDAKVEVIADGFDWAEGPLWVPSQQMLLVSDIFKNSIYKWTEKGGKELYLKPSGYTQAKPRGAELGSNALAINSKGQLVLCQHGDRRIAIMDAPLDAPKPVFISVAVNYHGKKFDSPNDMAIKSNGEIYFTDPPYGLEKGVKDSLKENSYQGVYRVSKDGVVTLLVDTLTRPNGIAFFPGEKNLLIANSDPQKPRWYIYDVNSDGNLANGRVFYDCTKEFKKEKRSPDGFKIDDKGNVFAAGPGGVWVYNKDGKVLGRIKVNITTSNCAFTPDYKTLFIAANHHILKIDLR